MAAGQRRALYALLAIPLLVLLFLLSVGLADRLLKEVSLDLTEDHRFTLSPATEALLADLQEPLELRLFISSRFTDTTPAYASYARRIASLLQEMAAVSDGKLRVERYDPEPFSPAEDLALAEGLQGLPLGSGGEPVYFGLVGRNAVDQQQVIPFFAQQRAGSLEYDLAALIASLARTRKPKVGIAGSLSLDGNALLRQPPQALLSLIGQRIDLQPASLDEGPLPADLETLMLIQPAGLSPAAAYALDQFVLRGGRLLLFLDPYSEQQALTDRQRGLPLTPPDFTAIAPLLAAWGLVQPERQVVADRLSARRVTVGNAGRQTALDYVAWLQIPADRLAQGDPLVAGLERLTLNTAGTLQATEGAGSTLTPLAWSSLEAELLPVERIAINPDPSALLASYQPGGQELTLAARLTGAAESAFPAGPPEGWPAKNGAAPLTRSLQDLDLIVVADSDLLFNSTWIGAGADGGPAPIAGNGEFVVNALEALAGGSALAELRGRGIADRPFTRIVALRREAELATARREQELIDKINGMREEVTAIEETLEKDQVDADAQRETRQRLRAEMLQAEQDLRAVQRGLRAELDRLILKLQLLNILAVPLLLAVIGGLVAFWRRHRAFAGARRIRG